MSVVVCNVDQNAGTHKAQYRSPYKLRLFERHNCKAMLQEQAAKTWNEGLRQLDRRRLKAVQRRVLPFTSTVLGVHTHPIPSLVGNMQLAAEQRALAGRLASAGSVRAPCGIKRTRNSRRAQRVQAIAADPAPAPTKEPKFQRPDPAGRYGKFGGKFVPETLIPALAELEEAYQQARADPAFQVRHHCGRAIAT